MKRSLILVFFVLGASCARASEPVLVGAVYPTGGAQGMGGVEEFRGVSLALELANRDGGVNGSPIRLVERPADSADAAPAAVAAAAEAGAPVVLGSYGSTISTVAARKASELGVVFWETGAVGELEEGVAVGDRFFRAVSRGESLGEGAVRFVGEELLPEMGRAGERLRYGVAYVDDVYGRSVGLGALEDVERRGLPVAGTFPYHLQAVDYAELADEIERSGTEVLIVAAYLTDGIELRRAMVEAEVPLVASVGTSSSYCMPAFGEILGGDAVGLFASDKPDGDVLSPDILEPGAARALRWGRDAYRERWNTEMPSAALSGFSSAWALFTQVLPGAASLDPDGIRDASLATTLPMGGLPNGSGLAFAPPGHPEAGANLRATSVIWEWVEPGTRAVVWPPELATSPILPLPIS